MHCSCRVHACVLGRDASSHPTTACSWGPPGAQQSCALSMAGTPPSSAAALPMSAKLLWMTWRRALAWLSSSMLDENGSACKVSNKSGCWPQEHLLDKAQLKVPDSHTKQLPLAHHNACLLCVAKYQQDMDWQVDHSISKR